VGNPRLSLCMIVKDEELLLEQALESVRQVVDEIVVVDTGSTDRSREIATRRGARVLEHAWDGTFAAARNAYLREARGEWVLVLDGDERMAARDAAKLRRLIENDDKAGYRFLVHNYTRTLDLLCDWHPCRGAYPEEEALSRCPGYSRFRALRLFRSLPKVEYEPGYSSHTNPSASLRATGGEICDADVVVHHFQCLKGGESFVARKQRERLESELKHIEIRPHDALAHLNVGRTLFSLGRDDRALSHLSRAVELAADFEQARLSRAIVRYETKQYEEAAEDLLHAVRLNPEFADAWAVLGMTCHALERFDEARDALGRALALRPFHPVVLNSFGVLLMDCGDAAGAERYFREALAVLPEHPAARDNLDALLAEQRASADTRDQTLGVELGDELDDV
jgi:Flp pilus assembly protein TadD